MSHFAKYDNYHIKSGGELDFKLISFQFYYY